ncbi:MULTISPECIES: restriction endonuclease subunit S [unclassified Thermosynechococcus]|uniref:restriction endonuclease subunit S n=1 Tax=unclassified Thermosynechococcus TaxID=2622553 RepID=UPI0028736B22|nr:MULTISPECIES: restriction endonuclease subunit S [unclassified Thermosynechococcus]WNC33053.1 restriction endonuclease subunit S [Thermosynechococcus sp. PKX95]WNC35579.1 restriction endonuclease subunit S [Thermosynechococcus sp. PKX91]WNC38100.1 restriction endonuclease subunit S [Thermosynechococcus sp. WL11]WNC40621.1 restriction endonuclease subunit S [Thermosynechococcus sp. WL17]WNC43141.1 restriction endonuclease subunit S [Thermosynechococcus sp. WL15]
MTEKRNRSAWPMRRLREVAEVVKGKKPVRFVTKRSGTAVPYLEASFLRTQTESQLIALSDTDALILANEADTLILWDGANAGEIFRGQFGVVASTMARVRPVDRRLLSDFLFYWLAVNSSRLRETAAGSTVPHVRAKVVDELQVPLPPLPVQERIVEILQKADEIRQKRKQALELVDKILPALFMEMFGDPATNPKGWPMMQLREVLESWDSGVWGERASNKTEGVYVLRSTNMPLDGRIDFSDVALIKVDASKIARFSLHDGDILLNRSSGSLEHIGKVSLFRQPKYLDGPFLFSNFVHRLRAKKGVVTSEYLFHYLRSDFARINLQQLHATSSGLRNLQMSDYLSQPVLVPPIALQEYFSNIVAAAETTRSYCETAVHDHECLFSSLLSRAFTGALTAEWEAANAEWIAAQQAFYERLPQLLILALIAERAKRARRAAEVLVTALMKYVFLVQMEGNASRRRLYHFVPYHYGPFTKELYADLERLEQDNLIVVDRESAEEKTRIRLADPAKAEQMLAELPDDFKEDIAAVIETYGDLEHNALLETIYAKYPAYAQKSRLRRRKSSKSQ